MHYLLNLLITVSGVKMGPMLVVQLGKTFGSICCSEKVHNKPLTHDDVADNPCSCTQGINNQVSASGLGSHTSFYSLFPLVQFRTCKIS